MDRQHIILKFMSKKEYAHEFLDGNLYMNSLYYFWNEYPIEQAKKKQEEYLVTHPGAEPGDVAIPIEYTLSPGQADLFEGTAGAYYDDGLDRALNGHTLSDAILRSVGYQYCNVLCFYRLDYILTLPFAYYDIPDMRDFGEYVVIIKNEEELLRRVSHAVKQCDYKFVYGDVKYHPIKKLGEVSKARQQPHIVLRRKGVVDMNRYSLKFKKDCFSKTDKFKSQNERRISLYRGVQETDAYVLKIGNIRDIAKCVVAKDLEHEIDSLLKDDSIMPGFVGYYGNSTREEMRDLFYQLGDYKAEQFVLCG